MAVSRNSRQDIIEQIKNLMAVAENPSASENERGVAAARVSSLIAKHQIENAELRKAQKKGDSEIVSFTFAVSNKFGLGKQRANVLQWALLTPMGGSSYKTYYDSTSVPVTMHIFIPEELADIVKVLLASFALQMESGMKKTADKRRRYLKSCTDLYSRRPAYTTSQINAEILATRRGYLNGWSNAVSARMKESRERAVQEVREEAMANAYAHGADGKELATIGSAIVLVDDSARSKRSMELFNPNLKKGRTSRARLSWAGYTKGQEDGRTADIGNKRLDNSPRGALTYS